MSRSRRYVLLLAVCALLGYGLAPVAAAFAPARVPLACYTAAAHACSCSAVPHMEGDCCCSRKGAAHCGVRRPPCDGGTAEAGGLLWTASNPFAATCQPIVIPVRLAAAPLTEAPAAAPRRLAIPLPTPPPEG